MQRYNHKPEFPKIKHFTICFNEGRTILLENIFLVKIYKKRGALQKILSLLFGSKYILVFFLKNERQIEVSFGKQNLMEAMELKKEITQKKLTLNNVA